MKIKHAEEYSIRQVIEISKDSKATELALKSSFEKDYGWKTELAKFKWCFARVGLSFGSVHII